MRKTITELLAKRIRRGQPWGRSLVGDGVLLRWAESYAFVRRFGVLPWRME